MEFSEYLSSPGVSNSALNSLYGKIICENHIVSDTAFSFGKLFESRVQETPDAYQRLAQKHGKEIDIDKIERMYQNMAKNKFAMMVMMTFKTQVPFFRTLRLRYNGIDFEMNYKCLFDFFLGYGGDLKTHSGSFDTSCERFSWYGSRVLYMLIAGTDRDFVIGVSKDGRHNVSVLYIKKGDGIFKKGYADICKKAYMYYMLKW